MSLNHRRVVLSTLAIICCVFIGSGAVADSGNPIWGPHSNLSNTPARSTEAILAQDPATGDLFVVWTEEGVAEREEVLCRRWDRDIPAWQPVENLSSSKWVDDGPSVFFDQQGQGLLVWTRRYSLSQGAPDEGTDLMWRQWDGSSWSPEGMIMHADSYAPGSYGLIPVEMPDSTMLFITQGHGYRTTEYRDGNWSEVTPWTYLEYPELDVRPLLTQVINDEDGLLHAAAYGKNSSQQGYDKWFYDAYYLVYDGASWSEPENLSGEAGVAHDIDMVFDEEGRLHVVWSDPDSPYSSESDESAIWERVYGGGTWSPTAEVTAYAPDRSITALDVTIDDTGTLHLAWSKKSTTGSDQALNIYHQTGDGTTWGVWRTVHTSAADSRYPVLAAGDRGMSIIWEEGSITDQKTDICFSRQVSAPLVYLPLVVAALP